MSYQSFLSEFQWWLDVAHSRGELVADILHGLEWKSPIFLDADGRGMFFKISNGSNKSKQVILVESALLEMSEKEAIAFLKNERKELDTKAVRLRERMSLIALKKKEAEERALFEKLKEKFEV